MVSLIDAVRGSNIEESHGKPERVFSSQQH
jgi:hypothetical protein